MPNIPGVGGGPPWGPWGPALRHIGLGTQQQNLGRSREVVLRSNFTATIHPMGERGAVSVLPVRESTTEDLMAAMAEMVREMVSKGVKEGVEQAKAASEAGKGIASRLGRVATVITVLGPASLVYTGVATFASAEDAAHWSIVALILTVMYVLTPPQERS